MPISKIRVGNGFDIHRLVAGRPLVLGGVHIPFKSGLEGFSDGDVLIHAVIDSLLGAVGLGDIGIWFPSGTPEYAGVQSTILLQQAIHELTKRSWGIVNIDSTVLCEEPRLAPFIQAIKENLSSIMGVEQDQLNVKATTMEKLGEIGQGEAIGALACALIESRQDS